MPSLKTSSKEWDEIRTAFASSIMVDTPLNSLAQNLEGPEWPIKGREETPAKYIDLIHSEALDMLALKGQPPERLDQLASILRETLAFDQPFGEMVEQVEASTTKDDTLGKNLARAGIPETFPLEYTGLSADTLEFCRLEKITTIGEFAAFAQGMAQNVIVGGDFRTLLNALCHYDEVGLARFLPLCKGMKGPQVPEALSLAIRAFPSPLQMSLARDAGLKLSSAQVTDAAKAKAPDIEAAQASLRLRSASLCAEWLKPSLADLNTKIEAGETLERILVRLGNPVHEAIVASLLKSQLKQLVLKTAASSPTPVAPTTKRGFWARLFGLK